MVNIQESDIRDFFFEAISTYGFITAQKELNIEGFRVDIFAIDKDHNPYVIEFKKVKSKHIVGQAGHYLALAPSCIDGISKKLNFFDINWNNLKVILIAPDFFESDLTAGHFDPLKGRIHFYSFNIVLTRKKNIFGLSMSYLGPDENGPMYLPSVTDENNLVDLYKRFNELDTKESKRTPLFFGVYAKSLEILNKKKV
jgi:hypothetical protein